MARVTYGESITEYAGSIGGVTFLRNASGPIAKLRSNPPVNPSPYQSPYQVSLSKLVSAWASLSQANKDAWDLIASENLHTTPWGESKRLSGYQWFISCNIYRQKLDDSLVVTPFAWYAPPVPDQFDLIATDTYLRCEWSPNYVPLYSLLIYLTLPLRQSSIKLRRSLFYVGYELAPGSIANYDLTSKFEALANVTWADFYASADCSIICRLMSIYFASLYTLGFTSDIVKIG